MIDTNVAMFMIAKNQSSRLPGKNNRLFNGDPMFIYTLKKMLKLDVPIYFNSNCPKMIHQASSLSNNITTSTRPDCLSDNNLPSVPLFQYMYQYHQLSKTSILNVQANSPSIRVELIESSLAILKHTCVSELLSIYPDDRRNNGSLWGFSECRLLNYGDPYVHKPDFFITDSSIDIHTEEDLNNALAQVL